MKEHELKTWPGPFQAIDNGEKRFEFRENDRDFMKGDLLYLREWKPPTKKAYLKEQAYTGNALFALVTYITHGPRFGIPAGYCCMSIRLIEDDEELSKIRDDASG